MDTADQQVSQFRVRFQRAIAFIWYRVRNPQLTGLLLLVLAIVIGLHFLLPQQTALDTTAAAWAASLPAWLQPWGRFFYFLGLSRIFQTWWFWLLVAALFFHSLVALADYAWPSWQRALRPSDPEAIKWQHPLAQRVELSTRLPASPDEFLTNLSEALLAEGVSIDSPPEANDRMISGSYRRRHWLGILGFYAGLGLLSTAFLLGHYYWSSESLTLLPRKLQSSQSFNGSFELADIDATNRVGTISFSAKADGQPLETFTWRLYIPTFFNGALIWPKAMTPVITIEAQNQAHELETLIPLQEDLSPSAHLVLPLNNNSEPFIFLIPSASLAFQLSPGPVTGSNKFNVQVRREAETVPSENLMIRLGERIEVDDFSVVVALSHDLTAVVRRDWILLLYIVVIAVVIGASALLLYFQPPWQIWLLPEVKGRGGQLYGVVEKFGTAKGAPELLAQLLTNEAAVEPEVEPE